MQFNNRFYQNFSGHYHAQYPMAIQNPRMVCKNQALADFLGFSDDRITDEAFVQIFSGQSIVEGMQPLAQKYTGHQFGSYNPDLGDGRGLLLGEVQAQDNSLWDLHLKGAGQTPYSRGGDGRAVLRSSIREFLASEALYHLGIPTSRALCVIVGDDPVYREIEEKAAITTRVCQSHIRFGHFEYLYHTQQFDDLDKLIQFTIDEYYPQCRDAQEPVLQLITEITLKTAEMVALWQAYGFCHGVMNSDNMSVLGITFDFGPFAFLDDYQPDFICNHSDHTGRYAFDKQPSIALWNLNCLAHAFSNHLSIDQLKQALQQFEPHFIQLYNAKMRQKMGLCEDNPDAKLLISQLLTIMRAQQLDYTNTWRGLAETEVTQQAELLALLGASEESNAWISLYQASIQAQGGKEAARLKKMQLHNPKYILRNYLLQQAIEDAEKNDFNEVQTLYKLLKSPFTQQDDSLRYQQSAPDWAKKLEISCSS
ncbi:protein adenylyltransferase SelO [Catenovulum sediminis]|uniref:protein adenylyltransferase SelO n=1 Tax=Catenovulum sediminis TaxID=1740262 RepID=UPI0011809DB6|nr:YdiU family protein [Catenovulum sediminis]